MSASVPFRGASLLQLSSVLRPRGAPTVWGFRVRGFRGLGFGGLGFRVPKSLGFRSRKQSFGFRSRKQGLGFRAPRV